MIPRISPIPASGSVLSHILKGLLTGSLRRMPSWLKRSPLDGSVPGAAHSTICLLGTHTSSPLQELPPHCSRCCGRASASGILSFLWPHQTLNSRAGSGSPTACLSHFSGPMIVARLSVSQLSLCPLEKRIDGFFLAGTSNPISELLGSLPLG